MNAEFLTFNNVVDLTVKDQSKTATNNQIIASSLANSELIANNFSHFRKSFDKLYTS